MIPDLQQAVATLEANTLDPYYGGGFIRTHAGMMRTMLGAVLDPQCAARFTLERRAEREPVGRPCPLLDLSAAR